MDPTNLSPVDVTKLSVVELKALIYDNVTVLDMVNKNIASLNTELTKRLTEEKTA